MARENLLRSIIETIVRDALDRFSKEHVTGDAIVRLSLRKRRLGFLWRYTATDGPERICWYIGSMEAKPCYFVCDDGTVGVVRHDSDDHWSVDANYIHLADVLSRLLSYGRYHPKPAMILEAVTTKVLRETFCDPAFDDTFCSNVLHRNRTTLQSKLGLLNTPPPVKQRLWRLKKRLRRRRCDNSNA